LSLLPSLYGTVIIPTAVANELKHGRPGSPGRDVLEADWLRVVEVSDRGAVRRFQEDLDPGEAEAVELTIELKADLLLIDESHGREVALRHGLPIIGVLGVLLEGKRRGLLNQIAPLLNELQERAGFWISSELARKILIAAGEQSEPK
jgi:predicted nucleic acid-binding protein